MSVPRSAPHPGKHRDQPQAGSRPAVAPDRPVATDIRLAGKRLRADTAVARPEDRPDGVDRQEDTLPGRDRGDAAARAGDNPADMHRVARPDARLVGLAGKLRAVGNRAAARRPGVDPRSYPGPVPPDTTRRR